MDWSWIDELCASAGGITAVLLRNLATGSTLVSREADREMAAASTIKVLLLAALLEEGIPWQETLSPREEEKVPYSLVSLLDNPLWSIGDLARLMILESDNTATNLLVDRLGMDRINEVGLALGRKGTWFRRKMMDLAAARAGRENVTTLADQARLYEGLYVLSRGEALSRRKGAALPWGGREGARRALEILLQVRADSMLLRYFTEEECLLAHKPGGLPYAQHEAGLFFPRSSDVTQAVEGPESAYFFGVFTMGLPGPEAKELIGRLSRDVYESREEWLHE